MDAFVSRKRRRVVEPVGEIRVRTDVIRTAGENEEVDSTDIKLATLASLYPRLDEGSLLDLLISTDGSVEKSIQIIGSAHSMLSAKKRSAPSIGFQASLTSFQPTEDLRKVPRVPVAPLTRKGATLHLYTPEDIAAHTPCSIIHNFLPTSEANGLLKELLEEANTFGRHSFKVFDNVVQSPHSACFYVDSLEEQQRQRTEYLYNGAYLEDVRQITQQMRSVSSKVRPAVNQEIAKRIEGHYPDGKKLKYQSPDPWIPNAAFVNCYKGGAESVGYHCDQMTYLGPRAVIGSLSLGVAREFRVRKIIARDDEDGEQKGNNGRQRADAEGQIAIHLPHNSLLVMHAEMQEEWFDRYILWGKDDPRLSNYYSTWKMLTPKSPLQKHSIHPAAAIDPHPIAGNKRINITYRYYRESFHPKYTPRCKCGIATVLRCVQRSKENRGRYMWMCHAGLTPGKNGCSFFQWAEFDDDGRPPWAKSNDTQ